MRIVLRLFLCLYVLLPLPLITLLLSPRRFVAELTGGGLGKQGDRHLPSS